MCAKREDMETVLKVKINGMLDEIGHAHKQEDELKDQIRNNYKQTDKEEQIVMDLHTKLQALEETLRAKEKDNEQLRDKVRDQQVSADCVDEFKERTETTEIHDNFKSQQTREEYGDLIIVNNTLKSKANDTVARITHVEKVLRKEEASCEDDEKRVEGLQKEHEDVTQRLESMLKLQEDIKGREQGQKEKIRVLREKHADTEGRANKLEEEVKKMENQLDTMTERLVYMKNEQDTLVGKMLEEKMKVDQTISNASQHKAGTHKAMKIRQRKD